MSGDDATSAKKEVCIGNFCTHFEHATSGTAFANCVFLPFLQNKYTELKEEGFKQIVKGVIEKRKEEEAPLTKPGHSHLDIGTCHGYDNTLCRAVSDATNEKELCGDFAGIAGNSIFNAELNEGTEGEGTEGEDFMFKLYTEKYNKVDVTDEVQNVGFGHCDPCNDYFEIASCPGILSEEKYVCEAQRNDEGVFIPESPPTRITKKKNGGNEEDGKRVCVLECHEVCHLCKAKFFDWNDGKCPFCDIITGVTATKEDGGGTVHFIKTDVESRHGFCCFGGKLFSGGCVCADTDSKPEKAAAHRMCKPCVRICKKIIATKGRENKQVEYSDRLPTAKSKREQPVEMRKTRDGQISISNINHHASDVWPEEYTEWFRVQKGPDVETKKDDIGKSKDHDLFHPPVCPLCLRSPIFGLAAGNFTFAVPQYGGVKVRDMLSMLFRMLWNEIQKTARLHKFSDEHDTERYLENCNPCEECLTADFYEFLEDWDGPALSNNNNNNNGEQQTLKELLDNAIASKKEQQETGSGEYVDPTLSEKELDTIWESLVGDYFLEQMIKVRTLELGDGENEGKKYVSAPKLSTSDEGSNTSMGGRLFADKDRVSLVYSHLKSSEKEGHLNKVREPIRYVFLFARCSLNDDPMNNLEQWFKKRLENIANCAYKTIKARVGKPMLIPGKAGSPLVIVPEYFLKRGSAVNGMFTDSRNGNITLGRGSSPERKVPGVRDMRDAILDLLETSANNDDTVTITCDAPIDLGGRLQIILQFAFAFPKEYHKRISILFFGSPITRNAAKRATAIDVKHKGFQVPGSFTLQTLLYALELRFNDDSIVPILEKLTNRNSYTPNIEEVHEAQRFLLSQYSDIIRFKRGETQEKRKTTATQLASSQFVSEDNNASTRQADEQPEEEDDDDDDEKRRDEKRRGSFDPTSESFLLNTEPAAMQMRETRNKSRETRPIYFLTKGDANGEKLIKVVPRSGNISTFEASTFEKIKNNSRQVFFTEPTKRQMKKRKGSLDSVQQEPQGSKRQKTEQP